MPRQVASAWKKVFKLSLPNDFTPARFLRKAAATVTPAPVIRAVFGKPAAEGRADTKAA